MFSILDTIKEKIFAEEIYNKYSKLMYKVAYEILSDSFLAEDAVQQALIKIIKNLDKIDKTFNNRTRNFIAVITKNEAINIYNKYKKELVTTDLDCSANIVWSDIESIVINKETLYRLKTHIKNLKPIYQIPLILNAKQGMSVNEISEILELKPKTVQKRLERARVQLIKSLCKEDN